MTGTSLSQGVTLATALLAAVLACVTAFVPTALSSVQKDDLTAVFTAAVPLAILVWAALHHTAAIAATPPPVAK